MPLRGARYRLRQREEHVEEALFVGHRLHVASAERSPHPRSGHLVARKTANHIAQVLQHRIILTGASDAGLLENATLEEELVPRTITPIGQNLERIQQSEPSLQTEPEPVEALLGGVNPRRYSSSPARRHALPHPLIFRSRRRLLWAEPL